MSLYRARRAYTPTDLQQQRVWRDCPRCGGRSVFIDGRKCGKCNALGLVRPRSAERAMTLFCAVALLILAAMAAGRCAP